MDDPATGKIPGIPLYSDTNDTVPEGWGGVWSGQLLGKSVLL